MSNSKILPSFQIGQCYTSEGEPELGIGFVKALDATSVAIEYPIASAGRLYRVKSAPLRRLEFRVGEKILFRSGQSLVIESTEVRKNLIWYLGSGLELCESELSPSLTLQRPMERFLACQWDKFKTFQLRSESLQHFHRVRKSVGRGMIGARIELMPHQIDVTHEIANRGLPRALLADEVGLGKTIEAALIMHRLLLTKRIRRVLIITPESLVNQWFIELFKRFQLSFWVPASQAEEDLQMDDIGQQERVILSLESLGRLYQDGLLPTEQWDLIIVDEAHRIAYENRKASVEYECLQALAKSSPGLLLLTATPEQLGLEGHFARLHLIDPDRFPDYESFLAEHAEYQTVSKLASSLLVEKSPSAAIEKALRQKLNGILSPEKIEVLFKADRTIDLHSFQAAKKEAALALTDHYGTGRVYFRNARAVVQLENAKFPKRVLHRHVLPKLKSGSAFLLWLAEFAKDHRQDKTLLICSSAKQVIEWEKFLREEHALKVASFHEELSLLARDRSAAFFVDPEGASLLLCSEIGGEGRNFQQARHLILADLPADPDVLEQRIGRLDRIGQKHDIEIHVPYLEKTASERLLRFQDESLNAFTAPPTGAHEIYLRHEAELRDFCENKFTVASEKAFAAFLQRVKIEFDEQSAALEAGRDRLLEINSFDETRAKKLRTELQASEQCELLQAYVEKLLDAMGLHSDDLDSDSLFVEPGQGQYIGYFPGLPPEGLSFTFSRSKALARTDLAFMSWDHPLVSETLEQLAAQEFGNVAVASWEKSLLVIECKFVVEPGPVDAKWFSDEFFPPQPIRVLMEATGRDLSTQLSFEALQKSLLPLTALGASFVKRLPGEKIRNLLHKASGQAKGASLSLRSEAIAQMRGQTAQELLRQDSLKKTPGQLASLEKNWWEERSRQLEKSFESAQVRLDSFLLVVPAEWGK